MAFEGQAAIQVKSEPSNIVGCLYIARAYPYRRKIVSPGSRDDEIDYFGVKLEDAKGSVGSVTE